MRPRILFTSAMLALLACGSDGGSPTGTNGPEGDILVRNNLFDPSTFNATVGTAVVWAWVPGAVVHNIVFEDGAPGSGDRSSGTFERTFTAGGTYPYICSIHVAEGMTGVVNVGAGDAGGGDAGGGGGGGGNGGGGGYDY